MPPPSARTGPAFTTGALLAGTFRTWGRGVVPTTVISVLFHVPLAVLAWALLRPDALGELSLEGLVRRVRDWGWISFGGYILLGAIATGAIAFVVVESLRGRRAGVGAALGATLRRSGVLVTTSIVLMLMAFVVLFVVSIVATVVFVAATKPAAVPSDSATRTVLVLAVAMMLGLMLLFSRYLVALPAGVLEKVGPVQAIGVSSRLTSGSRGAVALGVMGLLLLTGGIGWVVGEVVEGAPDALLTAQLAGIATNALLTTPLLASAAGFAYQRLKLHKDGVDVLAAARVFE